MFIGHATQRHDKSYGANDFISVMLKKGRWKQPHALTRIMRSAGIMALSG